MNTILIGYGLAAALWGGLFSPWTRLGPAFWPAMAVAVGILALFAFVHERERLTREGCPIARWVGVGLLSALVLYAIFGIGHVLSAHMFSMARSEVRRVYALKSGMSVPVIGILLVFWIGPCEEIFWRGFLQRRLVDRLGPVPGWIVAALMYSAVHLWTMNAMLLIAAFVCGLFWGLMMWKFRSLWPGIISHAAWDLAIFVLFPLA